MKRKKLFFLNAAGLAAVNITLRFISVSFNAYVSEKIGAESMGLFTLVMSVYGLAVVFACSGVNLAAVRLSAERTAVLERRGGSAREFKKCTSSVIRSCLLYCLLFSFLSSAVLFIFSRPIGTVLLGDERCIPSLRTVAVSLPAISVSSALSGFFTGVRKAYKNACVTVTEQFLKIAVTSTMLVAIVPYGGDPVKLACLAVVGGSAIAEGCSLIFNSVLFFTDSRIPSGSRAGNGRAACEDQLVSFRAVSEISLPTAVGSWARSGLVTAEHLLIPWGLKKNGAVYSAALSSYGVLQGMVFPLILFPSALTASFSALLIPEVAGLAATGDFEKINRAAQKAISVTVFFAIGISALFIVFSKELGMGLYKEETAPHYIMIISPLLPVMYLDTTVDAMLKGLGAQLDSMKINIVDAACSLLFVFLLVPRLGIYGYIVTVYICEILNFILSITRLKKISGFKLPLFKTVLFSVSAALISVLTVKTTAFFIPITESAAPLMIAAFSALYFSSVFLTREGRASISRLLRRV